MTHYILPALFCIIAVVAADKLNNVYLPPAHSISSGGSGDILRTPLNRIQQNNRIISGSFQKSQQKNIFASQQSGPYRFTQQSSIQQPSAFKNYVTGPVQPQIAILKFNNDNNGDGNYRFEYETENKISQQEVGQLKNGGTDQEGSVVQGSYSYVGVDGQTYTVNYIADELGFRATGDHLPVAPPIPEEILKSLQQNAAEEARGIVDDGQYRDLQSGIAKGANINRQYLAPKVQGGYRKQDSGYRY